LQFFLSLRRILQKQHKQDARLLRRQVIPHHSSGVHHDTPLVVRASGRMLWMSFLVAQSVLKRLFDAP
jgi:hypothetical protein